METRFLCGASAFYIRQPPTHRGVYVNGQLVDTTATCSLETPTNGVFIAVSGAAKCKIVVR